MAKQIKALKCPQCGIATPILIATFAQIYWAMGSFSDQLSSVDLERLFVEDAVWLHHPYPEQVRKIRYTSYFVDFGLVLLELYGFCRTGVFLEHLSFQRRNVLCSRLLLFTYSCFMPDNIICNLAY